MNLHRREFGKIFAAGMAQAPAKSYDVAVIGAGVFGSWTAYRLVQGGRSVILIDAYGSGNSRSSSGGESRIIRMSYGPDEVYTRFAFRSLGLWQEFFAKAGKPLFRKTGVLWMGLADHPSIKESRAVLARLKIPFEYLDTGELRKRYPQIRISADIHGILEPGSGALMARQAVQAVAEAAVQQGAAYVIGAVEPVQGSGRLDTLRITGGARIHARTYVFACGPWLPKVFPELLGNRIFPTRQAVMFFGPEPGDRRFSSPALPVWSDNMDPRGPYGFPEMDGRGFKLAFDTHGPPFDPDKSDRRITDGDLRDARSYLAERFPALAKAPLLESRVCQYENTSNGDFLIDTHPALNNLWLVGGGSGHGFKHGPAVGEYAANRLRGIGPEERRFSLESKGRVQHRTVH
jgi:sarcosine oxidase